jgi:hypothetical protein
MTRTVESGCGTKEDEPGIHPLPGGVEEDFLGFFVAGLTLGVTDRSCLVTEPSTGLVGAEESGTSRSDERDLIGA